MLAWKKIKKPLNMGGEIVYRKQHISKVFQYWVILFENLLILISLNYHNLAILVTLKTKLRKYILEWWHVKKVSFQKLIWQHK